MLWLAAPVRIITNIIERKWNRDCQTGAEDIHLDGYLSECEYEEYQQQ